MKTIQTLPILVIAFSLTLLPHVSASGLTVVNVQAWHEGCCIYVTGGIVNNGDITQYRIRIQLVLYDSEGQMLGEGRTPCTPNFLAHGQPPCRFTIQLHGYDDLQQEVDSYTYRIISQDVP